MKKQKLFHSIPLTPQYTNRGVRLTKTADFGTGSCCTVIINDFLRFFIDNNYYCNTLNFKYYVLNKSYFYKKIIVVIQTFNVE